jgi:hypothetical protein
LQLGLEKFVAYGINIKGFFILLHPSALFEWQHINETIQWETMIEKKQRNTGVSHVGDI